MTLHHSLRDYWQSNVARKRGDVFFSGAVLDEASMLQEVTAHSSSGPD